MELIKNNSRLVPEDQEEREEEKEEEEDRDEMM